MNKKSKKVKVFANISLDGSLTKDKVYTYNPDLVKANMLIIEDDSGQMRFYHSSLFRSVY